MNPRDLSVTPHEPAETVTVERRRAIFRTLVEAQDTGMSVPASRSATATKFEVSEDQVVAIEREGMENEWPPL